MSNVLLLIQCITHNFLTSAHLDHQAGARTIHHILDCSWVSLIFCNFSQLCRWTSCTQHVCIVNLFHNVQYTEDICMYKLHKVRFFVFIIWSLNFRGTNHLRNGCDWKISFLPLPRSPLPIAAVDIAHCYIWLIRQVFQSHYTFSDPEAFPANSHRWLFSSVVQDPHDTLHWNILVLPILILNLIRCVSIHFIHNFNVFSQKFLEKLSQVPNDQLDIE